mmetsp:Transcript_76353/g.205310  ORF Transcript_76353/g.205310 Transcript_76353/m.205310 type:complete len:108 (-) Transcript_76353:16-339(-)
MLACRSFRCVFSRWFVPRFLRADSSADSLPFISRVVPRLLSRSYRGWFRSFFSRTLPVDSAISLQAPQVVAPASSEALRQFAGILAFGRPWRRRQAAGPPKPTRDSL